jgi:hypothetical protein
MDSKKNAKHIGERRKEDNKIVEKQKQVKFSETKDFWIFIAGVGIGFIGTTLMWLAIIFTYFK